MGTNQSYSFAPEYVPWAWKLLLAPALKSLDKAISKPCCTTYNCSLQIHHSLFKNRCKPFCGRKEYWVQRSPSAVGLTFQLQTATKLTLKTTVHQEKSEAEAALSDGGSIQRALPPLHFVPTRATYNWGKQPNCNTGEELSYSERRSVIQRVPQHRRSCRSKRFPTSHRILRSFSYS